MAPALMQVRQAVATRVWDTLSTDAGSSHLLHHLFAKDPTVLGVVQAALRERCSNLPVTAYVQAGPAGTLSKAAAHCMRECGVEVVTVANPRGKPEVVDHRIKDDLIAMLSAGSMPPTGEAAPSFSLHAPDLVADVTVAITTVAIATDDLDFAQALLATTAGAVPYESPSHQAATGPRLVRLAVPVLLHTPFLAAATRFRKFVDNEPSLNTVVLPRALCAKRAPFASTLAPLQPQRVFRADVAHSSHVPTKTVGDEEKEPSEETGAGGREHRSKSSESDGAAAEQTPPQPPAVATTTTTTRQLQAAECKMSVPAQLEPEQRPMATAQCVEAVVARILQRLPKAECRIEELPVLSLLLESRPLPGLLARPSKEALRKLKVALQRKREFRFWRVMVLPEAGNFVGLAEPLYPPVLRNPLHMSRRLVAQCENIVRQEGAVLLPRLRTLFPDAYGHMLVTSPFGGLVSFCDALVAASTVLRFGPGDGHKRSLVYPSGMDKSVVLDILAECPEGTCDVQAVASKGRGMLLHACGSVAAALCSLAMEAHEELQVTKKDGVQAIRWRQWEAPSLPSSPPSPLMAIAPLWHTVRAILQRLPGHACRIEELPPLAWLMGVGPLPGCRMVLSKAGVKQVREALSRSDEFRLWRVQELPDCGNYVGLARPPLVAPRTAPLIGPWVLSLIEDIVKQEGMVTMSRLRTLFLQASGFSLVAAPYAGLVGLHRMVLAASRVLRAGPGKGHQCTLVYPSGLRTRDVASILATCPNRTCALDEVASRAASLLPHWCGNLRAALRSLATLANQRFSLILKDGEQYIALQG